VVRNLKVFYMRIDAIDALRVREWGLLHQSHQFASEAQQNFMSYLDEIRRLRKERDKETPERGEWDGRVPTDPERAPESTPGQKAGSKPVSEPDFKFAEKPKIPAALRNRPAMCAASCYEIEPGRWIRHPWDACATVPSPRPAEGAQRACKHCDGTGECDCPACTLRRTSEPTPCSMCRWEEHRWWVAATRPET
jgi:hypothetical protein